MSAVREGRLAPSLNGHSSGLRATGLPARKSNEGASSRRLRRFRGFGQRLKYVQETVTQGSGVGPDYGWMPARISSTLTLWGVPEGLGGRPAPLGLSPLGNSQGNKRRGLEGLPKSGRKRVTELLALLEEFRPRLAFWHVTLPDEDYEDLRQLGTWPVFQRRLFDRLTQYLKEHGDPALMVGVCEVGEKRLERTSRPMPHLHIVTTGYRSKVSKGTYLLRPSVMDGIVQKACLDACLLYTSPSPRDS